MSEESWKAEYYPVDAKDVSKDDAIAHSLQKFIGLRRENLENHGVELEDNVVCGIEINSDSCALCHHYMNTKWVSALCISCPIALDTKKCSGDDKWPWGQWATKDDPEPMIAVLQKAQAEQAKERALRLTFDTKYIVGYLNSSDLVAPQALVFSASLPHADFSKMFSTILGAGYVTIGTDKKVIVHGDAITIKSVPRLIDHSILERALFGASNN